MTALLLGIFRILQPGFWVLYCFIINYEVEMLFGEEGRSIWRLLSQCAHVVSAQPTVIPRTVIPRAVRLRGRRSRHAVGASTMQKCALGPARPFREVVGGEVHEEVTLVVRVVLTTGV
jgi:hypothetical protein